VQTDPEALVLHVLAPAAAEAEAGAEGTAETPAPVEGAEAPAASEGEASE
jgi:hypothetical protein